MDLAQEFFQPMLDRHPFFYRYARTDANALRQVTVLLQQVALSKGDDLFHAGAKCANMFFCSKGILGYTPSNMHVTTREADNGDDEDPDLEDEHAVEALNKKKVAGQDKNGQVLLGEGNWCCEAALFTSWIHMGSMRAKTMVDLLAIEGDKFADITMSFRTVGPQMQEYAKTFIENLNADPTYLTDLALPLEQLQDCVNQSFGELEGEDFPRKPSVVQPLVFASARITQWTQDNPSVCNWLRWFRCCRRKRESDTLAAWK
jgi:hypothetical protein